MNDLLPANPSDAQIERANKIIDYLNAAIDKIPVGGEDGILGILEQIIGAETATDLDKAWDSAGFGKLLGYRIRVSNPRKLKSQYKGTIPFFLVCDAMVVATGEATTATTSSYAIMAQVLTANEKGLLPLDFVPHEAEEPTENGFYPQHLKVWRPGMADQPAPATSRRERGRTTDGEPIAATTARLRAERLAAAKPESKGFDVPDEPGF